MKPPKIARQKIARGQSLHKSKARLFQKRNETPKNCKMKNYKGQSLRKSEARLFQKETNPQECRGSAFAKVKPNCFEKKQHSKNTGA
jgi:hypothetical protein